VHRVLVVVDQSEHPPLRGGLLVEEGLEVVGETEDGAAARVLAAELIP
jgi:hypothetical protein